MKKIAFIFPGQGSQFVGMGKSLYEGSSVAREVFDSACDILGFDIKKLCFEGPEEELNRTENTQPALLTASVAALEALEKECPGLTPSYSAGHSLGEYTALVAAGVLSFKDALRLVRLRGRFMQESVEQGRGAMSAILGLKPETVKEACIEATTLDSTVVAANLNSPEQTVISGDKEAVERAAVILRAKGAKKVILLPVSVPSHSPLMASAARRLFEELKSVRMGGFKFPVISNVEALPVIDPSRVGELLFLQLTSPVRWVESVVRMRMEGIEATIEIGPGKALTGLVKRIEKDIKTLNFAGIEDIEPLCRELGLIKVK